MDSFSVRTTLTPADWRAHQRASMFRVAAHQGWRLTAISILFGMALTLALLAAAHALGSTLDMGSILAGAALIGIAVLIRVKVIQRRYYPGPDSAALGAREFVFSAEGLHVQTSGSRTLMQWTRCRDIELTPEHIFIWLDRISAHCVPVRDLPAELTPADAVARLRAFVASSAAVSKTEPDAEGEPARATVDAFPERSSVDKATAERASTSPAAPQSNALGTALRLWLLRRPGIQLSPPGDWTLLGFGALSLALWLLFDWLDNRGGAEFYPYGMPEIGWYVLGGLWLAWVLSRRTHPPIDFRRAAFIVVAVAPVLIIASWVLQKTLPERWELAAEIAVALYAVVYFSRSAFSLTGVSQIPAAAAACAAVAALFWLTAKLEVNPSLWTPAESEDDTTENVAWTRGESLLFDQPERIDGEVAQVKAAKPDGAGVYFLGFAGVGEQHVFAEEIKLAAREIGSRYGTQARTVLLLNDARDLDGHPMATVSGLRRALKGMASRMDLERDVLFLSLSSHGADDPMLSVSNGPLPLQQLTADELAAALHDSAIQWKVIVISACYAGAFIDALRDDHTVILTAAASNRTSFGCSNDRDLTYFGEAFYRDALPHATSLREAFAQALRSIAARENAEGIEASNPQAFFGAAMEAKLTEIERRAGDHADAASRQVKLD